METDMAEKIEQVELFAWVGEDEFTKGAPGTTPLGLKQAVVPAGTIAIVAVDREKVEKYWPAAEEQAARYGKRIRLARFTFAEVLRETKEGA